MDVKYTILLQGYNSFKHFMVSPRALWIPSFRKKYSFITKLFNFENCVILAQIKFNLKLSNLDIFEIFDTADQSFHAGLSNDVSTFFYFDYSQSYTRFSNVSKKWVFLQGTVGYGINVGGWIFPKIDKHRVWNYRRGENFWRYLMLIRGLIIS